MQGGEVLFFRAAKLVPKSQRLLFPTLQLFAGMSNLLAGSLHFLGSLSQCLILLLQRILQLLDTHRQRLALFLRCLELFGQLQRR